MHESTLSALNSRWNPPPSLAHDPVLWTHNNLPDIHLWTKQQDILNALTTHPHVAVQSCHSAGKSFLSALATCWWIDSHPPGEAFVVTTAPTGDQVKVILWREMHRMHTKANLPGKLNQTEWLLNGETVALGRKPNEYEPTAFQGIHARYVLVILDEACGVPKMLWDAASTLTSNQHGRILAVGNPDDPQSHFARICQLTSWDVHTISAFDTPNFTGEEIPEHLKDMLVSERWVKDKAEEWGENSSLYQSKVLGKFPQDSEDGVIPSSWVAQCRNLDLPPLPADVFHTVVGLDVGAGGDRTVARVRAGRRVLQAYSANTPDSEQVAALGFRAVLEHQATAINVDSNGIGWGVCGLLRNMFREAGYACQVVPVNTSKQPRNPKRFHNLRAELWWEYGREASRQLHWDLSREFVTDAAVAELTEPRYRITPAGKILVEPKPEVKKRLGRSPDEADALLLAFYEPKRNRFKPVSGEQALLSYGPVPEDIFT